MQKAKVGIYLRFRTLEGKQSPYRPAVWDSKKRLRVGWCFVAGIAQHHPEATYHLRYTINGKSVWESVKGADPIALRNARIHNLAHPLEAASQRLAEAVAPNPQAKPRKDRLTLDDAARIYLTTGKAAEKDWRKHTVQCYKLAPKLFRDSCEKVYMDEITGDDLRQFKVFLRQQQTTVGTKIDPRSPVGLKLAYCYWMELGRSPRFHTAKTLLAWSPQMDSLLAKSCLDYERFKWFLVWGLQTPGR
jgi:hypothetical protein